ncbi:hypothetical protein L7F22_044223 [Adiantum nelumboides]|nr:hypothetical protein [Adiantum nelumboides]
MLVIQQTPFKGSLPQPSGPSIAASPAKVIEEKPIVVQKGLPQKMRTRTMARSTSMFQPTLGNRIDSSISSNRSTSPLSSASSSQKSSLGLFPTTTSTPASTIASSTPTQKTRGSRKLKQEELNSNPSPLVTLDKGKGVQQNTEDPAEIQYDIPEIALPPFARSTKNVVRDLARTWEAVANARRIVVICGAGISVSSPANIPDFRSAQGLFRKLKEKHPNVGLQSGKDLFDANLFKSPSTSALFYSMVSELKAMADAATPTSFHHLLKRLDMEGRLMRVYTQNIDGLEEKAGLSFGLGHTGDSRKTLRNLGKRKREAADRASGKGRAGLSRCKSDSAVLFGNRAIDDEADVDEPMFPRAIPLHGSLSTMTCQVCGHKIYLSLASPGPQTLPQGVRELSPSASDQAVNAMDLLSQGESVPCKQCETADMARTVVGLRSRGIGMMKVDVVLYNGQNEGAERVGDCVERDILGLRDPNEPLVPENSRERILRKRKERKEAEHAPSSILGPILEAATADEAFASAFGDEEDEDRIDARLADEAIGQSPPALDAELRLPQSKPKRQPRLKPLPPDLLIVAGTSLKVPGTKRIVREFAKSCQARDHREYPSSEEDSDGEESKGVKTRRSRSKSPQTGSNDNAEDEEDDINAPIRTILLNYDFPLPHGQWEDVFDVWVQGDVQQAALGLWEATNFPDDQAVNDFSMSNDDHHKLPLDDISWSQYRETLEAERIATKKAVVAAKKAASKSASQQEENGKPSSQARKGKTETLSQKGSTDEQMVKKLSKPKATKANPLPASPNKKKVKNATPKDGDLTKYMKGTKATITQRKTSAKASK